MQDTSQETIIERPRSRWSRVHSIWLLLGLSLLPGVLIALFRESWTGLPAGIRGGTYVVCAGLLAAACLLIMRGGEER